MDTTRGSAHGCAGSGDELVAELDELDELAAVPTQVLAWWVSDRGRCVWETAIGKAPEWTENAESDRDLADRLCAGCPVRSECLELELRVGGAESVGVWGGLNEDDRRALHEVWSRRRRLSSDPGSDEVAGASADEREQLDRLAHGGESCPTRSLPEAGER